LSQKSLINLSKIIPAVARKCLTQIISLVVVVMALYLTSANKCDMVPCFFVFYAKGEPPSVTKNPVKDRLVRGHVPQSKS